MSLDDDQVSGAYITMSVGGLGAAVGHGTHVRHGEDTDAFGLFGCL